MNEELKSIFDELERLLDAENESNWIRGVRIICHTLKDDKSKSDSKKLDEVKQTYMSMCRGVGSFSDYYIHRDDFDERVQRNLKLDKIRNRLWYIFSS
jgi:hypothetical protein